MSGAEEMDLNTFIATKGRKSRIVPQVRGVSVHQQNIAQASTRIVHIHH
jgi:hypothetical protein